MEPSAGLRMAVFRSPCKPHPFSGCKLALDRRSRSSRLGAGREARQNAEHAGMSKREPHPPPRTGGTGTAGPGPGPSPAYSRDHVISVPGRPDIPGSSDPAFRGDAHRYNPEDMLVASISTCHMLWYLHLASE